MKICILASGSRGNCTYIETKGKKILIDVGISFKQINLKLKQIDVDINDITSVFITHEHLDHVLGLRTFSNNINCDFYLTQGTFDNLKNNVHETLSKKSFKIIKGFDEIEFEDLLVKAIPIHHDAKEPLGFKIINNTKTLVFITDTGYMDASFFHLINDANCYIIESNYDPAILQDSNRPRKTKNRISGDLGHMSNEDCAINLCSLIGENTKYVIHAHISLECNSEELIVETFRRIFFDYKKDISHVKFSCAKQYEISGVIEL